MIQTDNNKMEEGIEQLLGLKPFPNFAPTPPCDHESDGYSYDEENAVRKTVTLRCAKCGIHYEEINK